MVNVRSQRSKEDDVQKISTSIYVTNFPEHYGAKDLWNTSKIYGHVVDAYIPDRRSKVARFHRESLKNNYQTLNKGTNVANGGDNKNGGGFNNSGNSYAHVVKKPIVQKEIIDDVPTMVLDESCLNKEEYSLCLLGKVKEFASLTNLKVVLAKEGFDNIELKYMGGFWVMIVFQEEESMKSFHVNNSVGSWFSQIIQAHNDFILEERVIWVEIEGVPCKWWSKNTFNRIASRWGTILNAEELEQGGYHSNRLCICTKSKTAVFESFKMTYHGKFCWIRAIKVPGWVLDFEDDCDNEYESYDGNHADEGPGEYVEGESDVEEVPETKFEDEPVDNLGDDKSIRRSKTQSEDPFGVYELLNKKKKVSNNEGGSHTSPAYPPGFTPNDTGENNTNTSNVEAEEHRQNEDREEGEFVGTQDQTRNDVATHANESTCSGHFKKSVGPRTGGSILQLIEDLINVGKTMGYDMTGCLAQKAKQDWVKKLCLSNKVNFLSLQETKIENIDLWCIKRCWGNLAFDYVYSEAVGQSGGILSVWDPNMFQKLNHTVSDYCTMVRGVWVSSGKSLLIISIYAPQELSEKRMLWDYLCFTICNWDGDVVTMGDFNEVRDSSERFGSVFNKQGAKVFNDFIANAGLVEVPLGGCSFTWCHKSASKMSKLDSFLIYDSLLCECPRISSVTLDRYLSDHRPIIIRESMYDYGPTPFKFYHYWFEIVGFDKFVEDSWNEILVTDTNDYVKFLKKLKVLKERIKLWNSSYREHMNCRKNNLKTELTNIDSVLDRGDGIETDVKRRHEVVRILQELEKTETVEIAQKAKIKWAIQSDENSKYYHGVINKKRSNLAIRGVLVDGNWVESPPLVKNEFYDHFKQQFEQPSMSGIQLDIEFPNRITSDQSYDLESEVSKEEIKRAVWDCGIDKAPGPDGFTFGFYRRYWNLIECDVVNAVKWFFHHGRIPNGGNSSFITLIPKVSNANMVKEFRPISLIGSVYKIVAKILANRLVMVLGDLVSDTQSAFVKDRQILDGPFILNEVVQWCKKKRKQTMIFKVDFEKAYDSVRWDFVVAILKKFGFGDKWCKWILSCLQSSRGSILVNGSPTSEFQFFKGLKQGDPLSPFLFILVMESLHISFQRVVDAGLFSRIMLDTSLSVSHLFYADDVIFMGQWNQTNIDTIIRVLKVFHSVSGLRINMKKSKLLGISVDSSKVEQAVMASKDARGLGVASLFALNRALMFKWVWRFITQKKTLWARVIKAIHGGDGKIGKTVNHSFSSIWLNIIQEVDVLKSQDLVPRLYMLESMKDIQVATKLSHEDLEWSFRRKPRGGVELVQMSLLKEKIEGCTLSDLKDSWTCVKTRWVKEVPIKINIRAWKLINDYLPTRFNLSHRGWLLCPFDLNKLSLAMANRFRNGFESVRETRNNNIEAAYVAHPTPGKTLLKI
ncbi:RNA-directed DNA polymerase, eukaryota [Tanacetum coccineum]